ncbi:MAG: trigger factor [Candidatus Eisenbacteria bacterium]
MNVQVKEESATRRVFEIEIPPAEIEQELERVVADTARRAALPGFRKGKVPRSMLEQRFGASFEQETLERSIERACRQAFAEGNYAPLLPAEIEDLKYSAAGPLTFKATIEVRPEVTAADYKGAPVTRRTREVTEADVEREIASLEEASTQWLDVERPAQDGDLLVVDHVRLDARGQSLKSSRRRDVEILLGSEGLLPAFQEGLLGASVGESRTLKVSYPADFANAELAGKDVQFHVKVRKIREKKVRQRDDNWAKETFGVDSLEDLVARIRLNLEGEAKLASRREAEDALVEAIVDKNTVPVPERWLERKTEEELDELVRRAGQPVPEGELDQLKGRVRASLERQVQREFLLEAIARQENLAVTDPEVGEELGKLLAAGGRVAQEFRALSPEQRRSRVKDVLERRKVFDFLLEHAQVTEEKASNESTLVAGA